MGRRIDNVLGDNIGYIELVNSMGNDLSVVNSARTSYQRSSPEYTEKDKKLLQYLIKNNHSSPMEHVQFSFEIYVPLSIERQWQRHRTWKYFSLNEVSRRYSSENIDFYIPELFRKQSFDNKQMSAGHFSKDENNKLVHMFRESCINSLVKYNEALEMGVARELARFLLPQGMYIKFVASVDLHNLLWFIELREHEHAQWEIVQYAKAIKELIKDVVPNTVRVWEEIKGGKN